MFSKPLDLVSLGAVWNLPDGEQIMSRVDQAFRDIEIMVYGRRQGRSDRVPITVPDDYKIDWLGNPPIEGDNHQYCRPRAVRRGAYTLPLCASRDQDVWEDLKILRVDFDKLTTNAAPTEKPTTAPIPKAELVTSAPKRRREEYKPQLVTWLLKKDDLSDQEAAIAFESIVERTHSEGKPAPKLPQRKNLVAAIRRIRKLHDGR